ncbi:MAG: hypothetical protein R3176_10315 [Woeseiaceae bacterium]|nr:hypothetical protein [Woeseiaceae bacterium]
MTLWIVLGTMSLLAALFVAAPLYRGQRRVSFVTVGSVLLVAAGSAALYARQGSPGLSSAGDGELPAMDEVVAALAERLEANPGDLKGWKMLGRSSMQLEDYGQAVDAFERANALEGSQNAQTLIELGEALLARDGAGVEGRAANLFEAALALDATNPTALFYGGIGALNRGKPALAADRWEALLAQDPPPEIRHVLEMRIAEWRGEPPPAPPAAAAPVTAEATAGEGDAVIAATISVADAAAATLPPDTTVFVIARDPAQPSPPIAVRRMTLAGFPATVRLGDGDAMMAGRTLSGLDELELVARASRSGRPVEQAGDWVGSVIVRPADTPQVSFSIDREVR